MTMLPAPLSARLQRELVAARKLHDHDLAAGFARSSLIALAGKHSRSAASAAVSTSFRPLEPRSAGSGCATLLRAVRPR